MPRLIPDLERFEYRTRAGERRIVLKNPRGDRGAGTYLTLTEADEALLRRMDGVRSVQQILYDHIVETGVFALDRLGRLTALLAANGFFGEERPNVFQRLARRRAMRRPIARLQVWLRRFVMWHIASWANAHGPVDFLYRLGGRFLFTRAGAALVTALVVAGFALWAREITQPRHEVFTLGGSYTAGLAALVVLQVLGVSAHELGHGLAIRHYGRRVRRLGFVLYYLMPCAYVDSTDMVMAPRSSRLVVEAAGSMGGLAFAGLASVAAAAAPAGSLEGSLALKAASLLVFFNLFQLLPILELDGYLILVDALDAPLLRQRAMSYARTQLLPRLRRRAKLTREELGLAAYGVIAIVSSIAMLLLGLWIWQSRLGALFAELWAQGILGRLAILLIALVFVGPLVLGLAAQGASWGETLLLALRRRRAALAMRPLLERGELLRRTAMFRDLTAAEVKALASQLEERLAVPGSDVVRQGDRGESFFLIASGEAEVVQGPEERKLCDLGPGDHFGEIALLQGGVRTATVRARTPLRLLVLDRAHFHRWARERAGATARIRALAEERGRLEGVPLFAALSPADLDRMVSRLALGRFPAGHLVCRQGEPGDDFYVIAEGVADVFVDGKFVRRLTPGPRGFFGEVALLTRLPRTATVRATTDLVAYALRKRDFDELVRASIDRGWVREQFGTYLRPALGVPSRGS